MAKVKVFISGPITGYENNNRAKFYEAERILRGLGFDVFNPVWMDFTDSWDHEEIMSVDLAALVTCDAIYQLEGWEFSNGALEEFYFAIDHNKDFVTYESLPDDMKFLRESVRVGAPTGVAAQMRDAYIARRGIRGGIPFCAPVRPLSFINIEHKEILQLLVDMTFKGASDEELERAIKYSKIVIDAEKDISIDWGKEYVNDSIIQRMAPEVILYYSAVELGIPELKKKYMPFDAMRAIMNIANGKAMNESTKDISKSIGVDLALKEDFTAINGEEVKTNESTSVGNSGEEDKS